MLLRLPKRHQTCTTSVGTGNTHCPLRLTEVAPIHQEPILCDRQTTRVLQILTHQSGHSRLTWLTSHRCRMDFITYLKFIFILSLFGSLLITGPLWMRKSKHFRWDGEQTADANFATTRTAMGNKTSQIFKECFSVHWCLNCTTSVQH